MADTKYIEIGEIHLKDTFYEKEIVETLKKGGFETALHFDGIGYDDITILRERTKND